MDNSVTLRLSRVPASTQRTSPEGPENCLSGDLKELEGNRGEEGQEIPTTSCAWLFHQAQEDSRLQSPPKELRTELNGYGVPRVQRENNVK